MCVCVLFFFSIHFSHSATSILYGNFLWISEYTSICFGLQCKLCMDLRSQWAKKKSDFIPLKHDFEAIGPAYEQIMSVTHYNWINAGSVFANSTNESFFQLRLQSMLQCYILNSQAEAKRTTKHICCGSFIFRRIQKFKLRDFFVSHPLCSSFVPRSRLFARLY